MDAEDLATRVRLVLGPGPEERRMFGGLAFLVHGHMAVAVHGRTGGLMVRVAPAEQPTLLAEPGAGPMVMSGGPVAGWLLVDPAALDDDAALRRWVERGVALVRTLPPKRPARQRPGRGD
jgi:TfoX/Sxy family transcriptional regulator of competence genes